jgi:hypothetical protein
MSDRDFVFAFLRFAIYLAIAIVVVEVIESLFKRYVFAVGDFLDRWLPARVDRKETLPVLVSVIVMGSIVIPIAIAANALGVTPEKTQHFFDALRHGSGE